MIGNIASVVSGVCFASLLAGHGTPAWEDTCTPIQSCQITIGSSGIWSITPITSRNGSCSCLQEECITHNCKYKANVLPGIPVGGSANVNGNCETQASVSPQPIAVSNCGGSSIVIATVYASSAHCTGAYTVSGYDVTCEDTKCGDGVCP